MSRSGNSLFIAAPKSVVSRIWDASGAAPLDDGPGSWNPTGGTNWAYGVTYGAWVNGNTAIFGVNSGAAGTITVGNVSAYGITFNAAGSGNYTLSSGTITLSSTLKCNASSTINSNIVLVANQSWSSSSSKTLTIGGVISGAYTLTYGGAGSYTLNGINTNSGNITVDTATVSVSSGASLFAASLGFQFRTLTIQNGATVIATNFDNGAGFFWGQVSDGSGNLIFANGGGTFRLTANTTMTINKGIQINSGVTGVFDVPSGVTASWTGNYSGRDFSVSGTLNFNINGSFTTSRFVTGTGTLTKTGSGTLTITGPQSRSSFTNINAGTVVIASGGAIYNGAYGLGPLTMSSGTVLDLQNWNYSTNSTTSLGGLSSLGTSFVVNNSTIRISGTTATTYGRGVTVNSGGVTLEAATGANWTIDIVNDNKDWAYNGNPTITFTGAGTGAFNKVLANGTGGLIKSGAGQWTLAGLNTYTGNTTINGGTLVIASGGAIYNGSYNGTAILTISSATLDLQNWNYSTNSTTSLGGLSSNAPRIVVNNGKIRISGATATTYGRGITVNSGGVTLEAAAGANWTIDTINDSNAWVYNNNPTITLTGAGTGAFQKVLNNGSGGLIKSGSGQWTISGLNTYTGNTDIQAGTLVVTQIYSGPAKVNSATFTNIALTVDFNTGPLVGETYVIFPGPTLQTYATVNLTGTGVSGRTGTYNSTNSTLTIS